ncbi:MAG TPA: hypothetical protein VF469_04920 [Kofleriaceae bacterium]
MRGVVALALGFGLFRLGAGCQSGKAEQQPPPAPTAPRSPATAATEEPVPAHVRLPRSPDVPARRTTRPLDRAELDRLAAVAFPDFDHQDRSAADDAIEVRHTTKTRPRLGVTVTISRCAKTSRARACPPMELAGWTARRDELAHQLPKALLGRPDTRFEIGARTIAGAPAIYTYQLGYAAGTDEKDQPSADYTDAYVVYYNDGENQLRVKAHYVDDAVGGIDQLVAIAPPEDLERLAVAFASFYVRTWN